MPIIEWMCKDRHLTEKIVLSQRNVKKTITCPKCGRKATKIISQSDFHLKGGCWEKDGYTKK